MRTHKIALILIISFLLALLFVIPENIEARRGCCSWHGGVCGCRCCDGTPLSAKCAPYYPSCNRAPAYPSIPKVTTPTNSITPKTTIERCVASFIGSTFCKGDAVFQNRRLKDCSINEYFMKFCPLNTICKDGECKKLEYCGDGACNGDETCGTCETDCDSCIYCGDGSCNGGESCLSCPQDCGPCEYCGDGICQNGENCTTCSKDCGLCDYPSNNHTKSTQSENDTQKMITGQIVAKNQNTNSLISGLYQAFKELFSWLWI